MELFAPWEIEKTKVLKDTDAIPQPSHAQFGMWFFKHYVQFLMMSCAVPSVP